MGGQAEAIANAINGGDATAIANSLEATVNSLGVKGGAQSIATAIASADGGSVTAIADSLATALCKGADVGAAVAESLAIAVTSGCSDTTARLIADARASAISGCGKDNFDRRVVPKVLDCGQPLFTEPVDAPAEAAPSSGSQDGGAASAESMALAYTDSLRSGDTAALLDEWSASSYSEDQVTAIAAVLLSNQVPYETGRAWADAVTRGGGSSAAVQGLVTAVSQADSETARYLVDLLAAAIEWAAVNEHCSNVIDGVKVTWNFLEKSPELLAVYADALAAAPADAAATCVAAAFCADAASLTEVTAAAVALDCTGFADLLSAAKALGACADDKFAMSADTIECGPGGREGPCFRGEGATTITGGGGVNAQCRITDSAFGGAVAAGDVTETTTDISETLDSGTSSRSASRAASTGGRPAVASASAASG